MTGAVDVWRGLDPSAPPAFVWLRPVTGTRCVLLLGAFDPPTNAHVAVLRAAAAYAGLPGAFCTTKVLLDRPPDELLTPEARVELLERVGAEYSLGAAVCNRGTYLDVARAARAAGTDAVFVIGSDKIEALRDPAFYDEGPSGVEATFDEVRFLVVPRGAPVDDRFEVVDVPQDDSIRTISASHTRDLVRRGLPIGDLVPPVVALALERYTRATEP